MVVSVLGLWVVVSESGGEIVSQNKQRWCRCLTLKPILLWLQLYF